MTVFTERYSLNFQQLYDENWKVCGQSYCNHKSDFPFKIQEIMKTIKGYVKISITDRLNKNTYCWIDNFGNGDYVFDPHFFDSIVLERNKIDIILSEHFQNFSDTAKDLLRDNFMFDSNDLLEYKNIKEYN